MSRRALALTLTMLLVAAGCGGSDVAEKRTKEVIGDLVARQYATATSRYRMFESEVVSAEAAPTWRFALQHVDATVREWAVDALSRIDLVEDLTLVKGRLSDPVRGVRVAAVSGLIRMDRDVAVEEFTTRIGSDEPEQVTLAASGFVELEHRPGAALIVERLQDGGLPESTRAALTQPLAALGGAMVVVPLVEVALDSSNGPELRRLAAEAAFAAEAEGVADQLQRLLAADDEYVRALAETMLQE